MIVVAQLAGGDGTWELKVKPGGTEATLTSSVDSHFYSPERLLAAALPSHYESAIQPAYDMVLKSLRTESSMDSLEFKGTISFPFKVQEQPLEVTPVKSKEEFC